MADFIIGNKVVIGRTEMPITRFKELIGNINITNEQLVKLLNNELVEVNKIYSIKICKIMNADNKNIRICFQEYKNKDLKKNKDSITPVFKNFMMNKRYNV